MTFNQILNITEFPYKVRLNSNYNLDGFNAGMIVSINSYKRLDDNFYELSLSSNAEDMEHNVKVASRNWYNDVTDKYDKNIFEQFFNMNFDSNGNFHIKEIIDGNIDIFDHYDKDGLNFDLESSKILYSLFKNSFITDINPETKKVVDRILKFGETL